MSAEQFTTPVPDIGARVRDTKAKRVGVVMDRSPSGTVWLRPERGGREWTVRAEDVEPADALRERVALANARSRKRL